MSSGTRKFTVRSRSTRPPVARPLGVEYLEARTVLSASQIGVIALDTDVFFTRAPVPLRPDSMFIELARLDIDAPSLRNADSLLRTIYVAPRHLTIGLSGSFGDERPPFPLQAAAPLPVVDPPLSGVPDYLTTMNDRPEGETGPPDRSVEKSPVPRGVLPQSTRGTELEPVIGQSRSATVDGTPLGVHSRLAIGDLITPVTARDWLYDVSYSRDVSDLDLRHDFSNSEAARTVRFTDLPIGEMTRMACLVPGMDAKTSEVTSWLDDVLADIFLPLGCRFKELLPGVDEGGLVDVGTSVETSGLWNGMQAEKSPGKRGTFSEVEGLVLPGSSWRESKDRPEAQPQLIDSNTPAVEVVHGNDQQTRGSAVSAELGADDEGGMIASSLSGAVSTADPLLRSMCLIENESAPTEQTQILEKTEIRMDAEVGFYQAFELATSPHASDAQAGVPADESKEDREVPTTNGQFVNE